MIRGSGLRLIVSEVETEFRFLSFDRQGFSISYFSFINIMTFQGPGQPALGNAPGPALGPAPAPAPAPVLLSPDLTKLIARPLAFDGREVNKFIRSCELLHQEKLKYI